MLSSRSATYRQMNKDYQRNAKRGNSPMTQALNSRRDLQLERRMVSQQTAMRDAMRMAAKQENVRQRQLERERIVERLTNTRKDTIVVSLLERIARRLENMDTGNGKGSGGLGNLLGAGIGSIVSGAALQRLLAGSNARAGKRAGLIQGADGKWRNAKTGRFATAPKSGLLQRGVDAIARSPIGRAGSAIARSPIGRATGRIAGKIVRSPLGRIAGAGARLGLNGLGKLAFPIAAGMAVFDGAHGMRHADEIMGRKTNMAEKTMVGLAQVVNGFLMGLPDWLSKKVFGQSFAKLMIDGLGDVKKNITAKVNSIWTDTTSLINSGLGSVTSVMSTALDGMQKYGAEITAAGGELIAAIKARNMRGAIKALGNLNSILGRPIRAASEAAAEAGTATNAAIKRGATVVATTVTKGAVATGKAVTKGVAAVAAWAGLGSTSAKYESGNRGVMAISSGKGDPGGASYGKYQLASKTGTLQAYLKESGYASQFAGLTPGSKEFNAKWRELGKNDPKFAESQHEFIKRTHYDKAASHAAKLGFNMQNRGIQDAVWSSSVQHGGVKKLLSQAAATPGWEKMSDEQKLQRLYEVREQYATSNMARKGASQGQIAGVRRRYRDEVNDVVMLSRSGDASMSSSSTGNIKVASTMAGAKAMAGRAAMSNSPEPLTEPLPVIPPKQAASPVKQVSVAGTAQVQQAPATKPSTSGGSSGSGGLPRVNDVADRPRIDLQAITTTLHSRG